MVNGVLYAMGGARRAVTALDPSTGELLWKFAAATVYGSEPLPARPEREQGERCACGAELEYFTSVDELHMEPHPDRRSQGGKSCGAH